MEVKSKRRYQAVGVEQAFFRRLMQGLGILSALAFVVGVFLLGQFLLRHAEARHLASDGADLVEQGQYEQAMPLLTAAWQEAPKNTDVLRNLARACDGINAFTTEAVNFWQQLADSGAATLEDRICLAAALVKASNFDGGRKILDSIPEPERHQIKCTEIEAALLRVEGRDKDADTMLHAVWESKPDDPSCRIKLAGLDLETPFEPLREKSRQTLWEIARSDSSSCGTALLALVKSVEVTPEVAAQIREILSAHPGVPSSQRLAILGACVKKIPTMAPQMEAEESKRYAGKKPEECPEYYEWLAKLGDAPRILNDLTAPAESPKKETHPAEVLLHPKTEVMGSRSLYLAFAEALIAKGNWNDLAAFLEKKQPPVNTIEIQVLRAICAKGLQMRSELVDAHLMEAVASARTSHNLWGVARIADVAEQLGRDSVALDACATLTAEPSQRLEALKRVFGLQQKRHDADGMMHTAESIVAMKASLTYYADHLAYLRLITGTDLESTMRMVAGVPSPQPVERTSMRRLNEALVSQFCGNPEQATQLASAIDPHSLSTGARAVLAGLFAQNGKPADAFAIAEKISPEAILAEENWYMQLALH
jgi:thioredoxin-like negative regulator of GroEL